MSLVTLNSANSSSKSEVTLIQGDVACGKSAEEIEMEKIMGFSGFHQSREKYFEEQSTSIGSAKGGFSTKYDKFFPPKSEFDSPTRKESKETKSRECKWLQLNEYETAPYFIQFSQNLTCDCLLISVFSPNLPELIIKLF